jgi:hypothetical protein
MDSICRLTVQGRLGVNYNAAILKFWKVAHPFQQKLEETDFFTPSEEIRS